MNDQQNAADAKKFLGPNYFAAEPGTGPDGFGTLTTEERSEITKITCELMRGGLSEEASKARLSFIDRIIENSIERDRKLRFTIV